MKSFISNFSPLFLALSFLFAPQAHSAPPTPAEKVFRFRLSGEPETLDWNLAHTTSETYLLMNLMEGLLGLSPQLEPKPALAQGYAWSRDGKRLTFVLRTNVKWSDGVPLTSKDFLASWKRLLSPVTASSYAYLLYGIEGAEEFHKGKLQDFEKVGIKAPDAHTFQITLKKPNPNFIYVPTFWVTFPIREDLITKFGNAWAQPGRMVTVGPFGLESIEPGKKIVLRKNTNYYKSNRIDRLEATIEGNEVKALEMFEAGMIDLLSDIGTIDFSTLSTRAEFKAFPYLKTGYLGFLVSKYPTSDPRLRRALAMGIDRSKIANVMKGGIKPASTFVSPPLVGYDSKLGIAFNPKWGKQELRALGYDITKPLTIEYLTSSNDKSMLIAQFIKEQLKTNLNVTVDLKPFDHKAFRSQLELKTHMSFESYWGADFPDADNFLSVFTSEGGINRTGWHEAKYDVLVERARDSTDAKKRLRYLSDAQKYLLEEQAVIIPLYYDTNWTLVRKGIKGLSINPLNYLDLRQVRFE